MKQLAELTAWSPLSGLGVLYLGGCVLVLRWLSRPNADLVLLGLGYGALALLGGCGLCVTFGAAVLARHRRRESRQAHPLSETWQGDTERWQESQFLLPALHFLPWVELHCRWRQPRAEVRLQRQGSLLHEEVRFRRRGEFSQVQRRLIIGDVFGLTRYQLKDRQSRDCLVLPHLGALTHIALPLALAGGDEMAYPAGVAVGDRVDLRRYLPGDPARFIHWKAVARSGKLVVRHPERAISPLRRTAAYLFAGANDEASAAAARLCIEHGSLGSEWLFCADGALSSTDDAQLALRQIARSSTAEANGTEAFAAFVERAWQQSAATGLVVFAPPQSGAWLLQVLRVQSRSAAPIGVLIGVDETPGQALFKVVATLERQRCQVTVVDRQRGVHVHRSH